MPKYNDERKNAKTGDIVLFSDVKDLALERGATLTKEITLTI
jgi:hypothetical protein